jgi:uncharacterized protein (TIGR02597 family)
MTVTLPAAGASPSNTTVSVPLYNTPDFTGLVGATPTATSLTLTGAALPTFTAANPRLVRVKTSTTPSHVGKFLLVTSNTATDVTVALPGGVLADYVAVGDSVEVVPANTLSKLFGPNAAGATSVFQTGTFFQTSSDPNVADNIQVWNPTPPSGPPKWDIYYNNGTNWRRSGALNNENNFIIYPDDGLFIVRRGGTSLSLTLMGTVPSTTEQTDLNGTGSTFFANRFPVDVTLLNSGIRNTAGWVTNSDPAVADKVYIWGVFAPDPTPKWGTFYHNGTNWRRSGALGNEDSRAIAAGTAVFMTKSSAGTTLSQALPYTP